MIDDGYEFYVLNQDGFLERQAFEVFAYPMGDLTVRRMPNAENIVGGINVLQVCRSAVDWSLVEQWAVLVGDVFPGLPRVLALPYLPSARGDKDVPSPAVVNARIAAGTGISDIITVDPHSPVWLSSLQSANPEIGIHVLPLGEIVASVVTGDKSEPQYLGVISPDKGAVPRATEVAALLGLPVYVAGKHRDPKTGQLTHYSLDADLAAGSYLVVDDICDGGGTFALLAGAVGDGVILDLWVTHGGFTKPGFSAAARAPYRRVYTTNSLPSAVAAGLEDNRIHVTRLDAWIVSALDGIATRHRVTRADR